MTPSPTDTNSQNDLVEWGCLLGLALIERAEQIARERGCKYAYTDTMEYQAPGFYEKAGFRLVGTFEYWDSHGHRKFLFSKQLSQDI